MKYLPFIFENQDVRSTVVDNETIIETASKQIINMNILLEDYIYNNLHQFVDYGNELTDIYENIKNFVVDTNVNNYLLFSEVLASTNLSNDEKLTYLHEASWASSIAHVITHGIPRWVNEHPVYNYLSARVGSRHTPTPTDSIIRGLNDHLARYPNPATPRAAPVDSRMRILSDHLASHPNPATQHTASTTTPNTTPHTTPNAEAPAPEAEAPKNKGKLRSALIKTGLVGGGVTGAVELTKAAYNMGLEHPRNDNMKASKSLATTSSNKAPTPASASTPKVYKHNPWAIDSSGHVSGTKYSPDQYKQYLVDRHGVDKANAAIARASGSGWTPQSLNR